MPETVTLDGDEAIALLKAVRSHDSAVIIINCVCPLCQALRKLSDLQTS